MNGIGIEVCTFAENCSVGKSEELWKKKEKGRA